MKDQDSEAKQEAGDQSTRSGGKKNKNNQNVKFVVNEEMMKAMVAVDAGHDCHAWMMITALLIIYSFLDNITTAANAYTWWRVLVMTSGMVTNYWNPDMLERLHVWTQMTVAVYIIFTVIAQAILCNIIFGNIRNAQNDTTCDELTLRCRPTMFPEGYFVKHAVKGHKQWQDKLSKQMTKLMVAKRLGQAFLGPAAAGGLILTECLPVSVMHFLVGTILLVAATTVWLLNDEDATGITTIPSVREIRRRCLEVAAVKVGKCLCLGLVVWSVQREVSHSCGTLFAASFAVVVTVPALLGTVQHHLSGSCSGPVWQLMSMNYCGFCLCFTYICRFFQNPVTITLFMISLATYMALIL